MQGTNAFSVGDTGRPTDIRVLQMATHRELIEGAYASSAKGDIPAALGAFADDIQWPPARR